jgi:thiol-disulfide isomerase/thioredoxin
MVKRFVPALLAALVAVAILVWLSRPHERVAPLAWPGGGTSAAAPPISGTVKNFTPTDPARPAPIEGFYDGQGRDVSLLDFGGKVVLLNLWATWCVPCLTELPSLDRLQAQLGGADFQVVAVSVDRRGLDAVRPFFAKLKIAALPIYVEPQNRLASALGLQVLPSTIIIGRNGTMRGKMIGAAKWDAPEALALIRYYVDAAKAASGS